MAKGLPKSEFPPEFDRLIARLLSDPNYSLTNLVKISGLDPSRDFVGLDISGIVVRPDENLDHYNFSDCTIHNANFAGADLSRVDFSNADASGCDFRDAKIDAKQVRTLRDKRGARFGQSSSTENSKAWEPDPKSGATMRGQPSRFSGFELPNVDILREAPQDETEPKFDKLTLERNAHLLENVLGDLDVEGEITAVRTGPVVTLYELELAPGVEASRVVGLAEDIARSMSTISARVSTIPGKTLIGIELSNASPEKVFLKSLAASEAFAQAKARLPIILGAGISGEPMIADLAAMPHLLIAGANDSGKSMALNCILLSLLYKFGPEDCRFILIDPKVLELKSYDDIPHLLSPVVTEPHKSVRALKWAVEEMEKRYRMMSSVNSRNINSFNDKVRAAAAKGKPLGRHVQTGFDPKTGEQLYEEEQLDYEPLPLIVLIVDELADLMVMVGKEIEVLIQRLSQKSRAAGIHLIMATQRPSVDVITGAIKANLPTRISFKVTSRIDSRTILGEQGAEQLLGKGDMLYKPNTGATIRVHGPVVSDEEVEAVADFWRAQSEPDYVDAVTEEPEEGGFGFEDELTASDNPDERRYRQACQIVIENQKASGSWLQRQMGVGYNTAAKWIERMESEGLVGPANHVGRREIFHESTALHVKETSSLERAQPERETDQKTLQSKGDSDPYQYRAPRRSLFSRLRGLFQA